MSKDGIMPETNEKMIQRVVRVDCTRTPQETLRATGRKFRCEGKDELVTNMPRGEGGETKVFFFKFDRWFINNEELEKEYELRGLKAADPYSLAKVNENNPAFADNHPNCTHWRDENGNWCFLGFNRWCGVRDLSILYGGYMWDGEWWFAGVCK